MRRGKRATAHVTARVQARVRALAEARRWIGTPYGHQASCLGAGCDCLGLIRGIWRTLYGQEAQTVPPYGPDVAGTPLAEALMAAVCAHFVEIDKDSPRPGDVLLFADRPGGTARHCAVLSQRDRIIHAYWRRSVVETALTPWWQRRLVAAFAFPDLPPAEPREEMTWPNLS
ncbi:putative phage cell wall peptidase, NlpC/P60 family [Maricaulis maris MCS10]|uniref:Putative phage cell wall peptidase, NlpC/P60 family n=1 Tax=Maricaulis maris (strain MCS10) TaxID=394221 RepID=Q0AR62_MARMM|nr:NlpC/P60 family protein [Maricaulis maris]ABI65225.1 putative phage cell wall peptidase, NlpC/P60 family [Maricaulis maris MCS10]